jgi:putative ABC transport system permease protein
MSKARPGSGWLLGRLALQNLGRRRSRTVLLVAAVAVAAAVVFAGATLMRSIETSLALGFTRLGADLMVVPEGALTNITSALLAVEPTDLTLAADLFDRTPVPGVGRTAPQRVYRTEHSGLAGHESVDLIGFDPARDFTVLPWIEERMGRAMRPGDVLVGARRNVAVGSEIQIFGQPFTVYGKLGRTGVGTHELGVFLDMASLLALSPILHHSGGAMPEVLRPDRVSGFLVELAPGATDLQARFAILSSLPGVKVVSGESMLTGIRQGLTALVGGMLVLVVLMFASTALMVGVLFSAIVTERRGELGLLKAIGARRGQIVGMMLAEAAVATGIGGLVGVVIGWLVLRAAERSLVYHLSDMGVPFVWLDGPTTAAFAVLAVQTAAAVGAIGALAPAWRASRRDAYDLIRGEG